MNTYKKLSLVLALGLGFSAAANSAVLYDLNPGSSSSPVIPGWIANAFSTGTNCPTGCTLGDITLQLSGDFSGNVQGIKLQLYSDGGAVPGPNTIGHEFINPDALTSTKGLNVFKPNPLDNGLPLLSAATTYWVSLDASALGAAEVSWYYSISGTGKWAFDTLGGDEFSKNNGTIQPFVMQVQAASASPVPVPAAGWLMGSALIGLVSSWRRKKAD